MISVNGKRTVPLNFVKNPGIVSRNGVDIGGIQTDKALYLPGYPYTGTQINDRSGNNNHGTISGSDYIESSVKEQINTATYDAFGTLLKISADSLLYIFTQGTTHDLTAKKKIVGQFYTPSTDTWGVRFDIYDDADADVSPFGNVWGIIGTKIYGFIGRYKISTATYLSTGFIVSTDLTASSWSAYSAIDISALGLTSYLSYGNLISTNVAGTYLVSFYGATAVLVYKIALLKSTDSGATWALGATIYSGATQYNESTIAHIGAGKIVCLSRVEAGGVLVQMASADNGETWGAPANSNLGTAGATVSIPFMIYDSDLGILVCAYLDRAAGYRYKVSWGDALTIYGDPTTWGVSVPIDSNTVNEKNGYISFVKLTGQYFIVYSKEKDAGDADIWGGTFSVPKSKWQRRPSGLWGLAHNGADSVVDFGDVCDAQNYLTLKTWIDVDQSAMNNRVGHIISKSDGGSTNKGYYLSFDDRDSVPRVNCIVFTVYQEVGVYISGGVALATGRHHIVAVFNKDLVGTAKVAIYVDKVAQALSYLTGGALATIGTNALPLRIGASSATPAASYCKFKHWLDVVIPEVAWTQAQVTDSYDKELWMPAS